MGVLYDGWLASGMPVVTLPCARPGLVVSERLGAVGVLTPEAWSSDEVLEAQVAVLYAAIALRVMGVDGLVGRLRMYSREVCALGKPALSVLLASGMLYAALGYGGG